MKLTADNVHAMIRKCLPESVSPEDEERLRNGEEVPGYTLTRGVMGGFCFLTSKLNENLADIESMLKDLPPEFMKSSGGGMSFLNACMTKDGEHWAEHPTIEELICLGMGVKLVEFVMPREMWSILPGGMPYFVVAA